jgi:hypothetical protein
MLRKANNVYSVLLNDAAQLTSALPAVGTVVTDANLNAGAIVLCDMGMRRLDFSTSGANYGALAATDKVFIVQGKGPGQPLMKSPALTKGTLTLSASRFVAAKQQVTYVGYNPSLATPAGALSASNATRYWIKVRKRDNDAANRSQPMSLFAGPIVTDSSATQEEVAYALLKNGVKNFAQEPANGYLRLEVVSNQASLTDGTATTITIANGSKIGTLNAGATTFVVGDNIRIGTTLTSPVYKITALSSTTITFNVAFQGDSVTAGAIRYFTATTAASAAYGVRLTGVAAPFNVNTFRDYYANRFTVTFSDSTVPVGSVGAIDGNGVWQKVAMDEYMSYGFEGSNNQLAVPSLSRDQVVKIPGVGSATALTAKYCALTFNWTETMNGITSTDNGEGSVVVYINLTDSSGAGKISTPTTTTGNALITAFGGITAFGKTALTDLDE